MTDRAYDLQSEGTTVLAERLVLDGAAIRVVERTADGDWIFLDRPRASRDRDLAPASYERLAAADPGVDLVRDLERGWLAWRTSRGNEWARAPVSDAYIRVERKVDESSLIGAQILDHEPGWLERLWLGVSWPFKARALRRELFAQFATHAGDPPGPDTNDAEGSGERIPRRPPDGHLSSAVGLTEPIQRDPS
jgi:hypothetical protein